MKQSKLSVRVNRKNTNHHIWNNNGKWWCHFTVHKPNYTSERHRISLHTHDVREARQLRDIILADWTGKDLRKDVAA